MRLEITTDRVPAHGSKKLKITCTTCALKKCVGRCHFERTGQDRQTPKAV